MPSPFPGMDPYLEMLEWQDFHVGMINAIRRQLAPAVRPKYLARIERRVYVERLFEEPGVYLPDVELVRSGRERSSARRSAPRAATATLEPHLYEVPTPTEHRESYVVIKDIERRRVVTVVELLSPTNKSPGSDGAKVYAQKRAELLQSTANLVEIDLLRKGKRPLTVQAIPDTTDYCVFVHKAPRRSRVEVYEWTIKDSLPTFPVPLADNDPDVPLNLQQAFDEVFEEAGYDIELPYGKPLQPPTRKSDSTWLRSLLSKWRRQRNGHTR